MWRRASLQQPTEVGAAGIVGDDDPPQPTADLAALLVGVVRRAGR
jgi:hypothetical protein